MKGMKWMGSTSFRLKLIGGILLLALLGLAAFRMGFIGGKPVAGGPRVVDVKALKVVAQDAAVTYEFVGEIEAFDSAQIRPKVTGNIVEKYVTGGAVVKQGQPLFRIEARQYETTVLSSDAALAESESALSLVRLDLARYKQLASNGAIAQQVLDNALSMERQSVAKVDASRAKAQQARLDLRDTLVVSPIDGRIDIKDVGIGNYATAGQTTLATVSFIDKVRVKFSMSENEYLKLFSRKQNIGALEPGQKVKLRLSDGQDYSIDGYIEQVDSGMGAGTGTMIMKALVDNPQKMLLPGMFARVIAAGEVRSGAIVIPQRAVQELLGKTFVTVVGEGEKAESRPVKMGPRVGTNWIVEEGIKPGDRVIVEGALKTPPGTSLKVMLTNG